MDFKKLLLDYYKIDEETFKYMSRPIEEVKLLDPFNIEVMPKIVERINKAITNKEKIIIYGDYDCDGISATSIMVKTFNKLNYPVSYYIPSRYLDGYGLNTKNTEKIIEAGYKLIITVDNGISAFEAIDLAKEHNVDVIVVDHHELPEEDVKAYAILHPIHSKIDNIVASGGYTSLFLSSALLGYYDEYLVTIAGLSVISDLMELKGYNRDVVRLAISYLKKNRFRPLMNLTDNDIINETTFSLEIAPKINAIGRIVGDTSINRLVKYLTSEDEKEQASLLGWILNINEERKELTKVASEDAVNSIDMNEPGIVFISEMKEGLIGLIANKLLSIYNKASCIFTYETNNKDILKGSMRAKNGFNVMDIIELNKDILLSGGGHSFAGGISINIKDYPLFKERFNKYALENPLKEEDIEGIEISLKDVTMENYEIVKQFSPFGMGYKEPEFIVKHIPTRSLNFISYGKHISLPLTINSKMLGFNMPSNEVYNYSYIDVKGKFVLNSFKGRYSLDYRLTSYKEAK